MSVVHSLTCSGQVNLVISLFFSTNLNHAALAYPMRNIASPPTAPWHWASLHCVVAGASTYSSACGLLARSRGGVSGRHPRCLNLYHAAPAHAMHNIGQGLHEGYPEASLYPFSAGTSGPIESRGLFAVCASTTRQNTTSDSNKARAVTLEYIALKINARVF